MSMMLMDYPRPGANSMAGVCGISSVILIVPLGCSHSSAREHANEVRNLVAQPRWLRRTVF
jgi:hypothetical protein